MLQQSTPASSAVKSNPACLSVAMQETHELMDASLPTGHMMPVPTALPPELGHYRIVRQLGAGGMGTVYLAEDTQLGCQVALKVPNFRDEEGSEAIERFYREARLARTIHHPYICPVYEVGAAAGLHYLTMPFVEGTPLNRLVGPQHLWETQRAVELVRRVALALQALHQRDIIHRDLKPHNIMVRANDEPMLMDFGLARLLKGDEQRLTRVGQTLGTPAYMAPEQITADPDALCPATDVYSLGVILYEVLTGSPPFQSNNLGMLFNQILTEPPPPLTSRRADLSPELDAICRKALAKQPAQRYATMTELARALTASLGQAGVPSPPPSSLSPTMVFPPSSPPHVETGPERPPQDVLTPCPRCRRKLRLRAALRGQRARCPHCQAILHVGDDLGLLGTLVDHNKPGRETAPASLPAPPPPPREVVNSVGMKLVWMAPGTFLMGSPPGEEGCGADEKQRRVTLTRGFFLGACPVTQAQWQAVLGDNPSRARGETRPVENVSWEDCQDFCKKLSQLEGRVYRLPTEAEWEYACRAGTTTPFSTGATLSTDQANFDGTYVYGAGKKGNYRRTTTPAGSFPPNAWGLCDLHGNVWEWCADWYAPHPDGELVDPRGQDGGSERVLRGGSWVYGPRGARSACRGRNVPTFSAPDVGCRVCFTAD